ncbi:MAG: hypothetical protein ACOY0T_37425 [Myxococcota bacterium]
MPDFTVRPVAGVELAEWTDPAHGMKASRLARVEIPPRYWRLTGGVVELRVSTETGGDAPDDSLLNGRVVRAWFIESPASGTFPTSGPRISSPPSHSSIVRFTPSAPGHYLIALSRARGGTMMLHFDKEP